MRRRTTVNTLSEQGCYFYGVLVVRSKDRDSGYNVGLVPASLGKVDA
jgi:hypothetical protein